MSLALFQGAQDVIEVERTEKGCFCPTCGEKLPARRELKGSKPMTPAQKQKATAKFYAAKAKLLKQAEALGLGADSLFPDTHAVETPEPVATLVDFGRKVAFAPQGRAALIPGTVPVRKKGLAAIHQTFSRVASTAPPLEQDPQLF
jgi:hypothetical protein